MVISLVLCLGNNTDFFQQIIRRNGTSISSWGFKCVRQTTAPAICKFLSNAMSTYFPNREELLFRIVFASPIYRNLSFEEDKFTFPKASRIGFACSKIVYRILLVLKLSIRKLSARHSIAHCKLKVIEA